jgi:hypothetical protein
MIKVKALRVEVILEGEETLRPIIDWKGDVFGSIELGEFSLTRGFEKVMDQDTQTLKGFKPTGFIAFKLEAHKQGPEGETK